MRIVQFVRIIIFFIVFLSTVSAQPPKLVVIVVLDQVPYEFLTRFQPYFAKDGGFAYLLKQGASYSNAHYEHAYMKTAPGHAAIATGTYSHINGIISNRWYDRQKHTVVNCVDDETEQTLGAKSAGRSPRYLLTYTLGDMLRLSTNFRSRVFGIGGKDRSAILMAGKLGRAMWVEDSVVVSSSYYMKALPPYLSSINASAVIQQYFGRRWTESNPEVAARICDADDVSYESGWPGMGKTFPHTIVGNDAARITPSYYSALENSPFASELLFYLARRVCVEESLGVRGTTDMLCVGIAATDIIGHEFGPHSHEVFDNMLRTDSLLGSFFSFLDQRIGLQNCILALTSDHGIAPIPEYIKRKVPKADVGRVTAADVTKIVTGILTNRFGPLASATQWLVQPIDSDIYLNRELLKEKGISFESAMHAVRDSLPTFPQFAAAYSRDEIENGLRRDHFGAMIERSFFSARSGDVMFVLKPYYVNGGESTGTNHGQPYEYDAHVPLIFVGKDFKPGIYLESVSPIDLAPTLATILRVEFPPDREGKVLRESIK